MLFRPAVPDDDEQVFRVFESTCAPGLPELLIRLQYDAFRKSRAASFAGSDLRIIEIDGSTAGYCRTDTSQDCYRIVDIALAPEFRGRGLGEQAMRLLIAEAETHALPVRLSVARTNPAVRLYERLGFQTLSGDEVFLAMELSTSQPEA